MSKHSTTHSRNALRVIVRQNYSNFVFQHIFTQKILLSRRFSLVRVLNRVYLSMKNVIFYPCILFAHIVVQKKKLLSRRSSLVTSCKFK